jgi:hypothetical protein
MQNPAEFIGIMTMMTFGFALVYPVVGAVARRIANRSKAPMLGAAANDPRMERMEQAIDAIAIEVERIAEAQRFQTRLLSERAQERGAIGAGEQLRRSEI